MLWIVLKLSHLYTILSLSAVVEIDSYKSNELIATRLASLKNKLNRTWFCIGREKLASFSSVVVKEEIVNGNVSIFDSTVLCTDVNLVFWIRSRINNWIGPWVWIFYLSLIFNKDKKGYGKLMLSQKWLSYELKEHFSIIVTKNSNKKLQINNIELQQQQ